MPAQAEPKSWGSFLLPNGKCNGIFNFDLGVWLLQWRALQFHISSQQLMSTSCQMATKTVPQGYPWTKLWFLCKLVIWGFGEHEATKWAVPTLILEGAVAPLREHLVFSSPEVLVLNFFPPSSWFQFKLSYHCFYAFKNWWNSFWEWDPGRWKQRPVFSFWLFPCWQFHCHCLSYGWWFLGCWSGFNHLLKKKVGRILNILFFPVS